MGAIDPAASFMHRRDIDLLNTERLEARACADDIGDRIQRSNFVEMNVINRHSVDFPFGFRDPVKDAQGMLLHKR